MLKKHLKSLPKELVSSIEKEFQKIHSQYFLGKWEPSQLDAGRFAEVILRVLEYHDQGIFTPLDTQINRKKVVHSVSQNRNLEDSLRIQIPNLTELLLDFRNRRNVAHLGKIEVNEMDATFILHASNWILAEIVRLETQMPPKEAQEEISKIIERKIPLIEDFGKRVKVLNPKLTSKEQVLIICFRKYPKYTSLDQLFRSVTEKNKTRLKRTLTELDKDRLIDFYNDRVRLTKRGLVWVEKNIDFELKV